MVILLLIGGGLDCCIPRSKVDLKVMMWVYMLILTTDTVAKANTRTASITQTTIIIIVMRIMTMMTMMMGMDGCMMNMILMMKIQTWSVCKYSRKFMRSIK